jgi:hypothetical protein
MCRLAHVEMGVGGERRVPWRVGGPRIRHASSAKWIVLPAVKAR